jgi:hypothetical protein
MHRHQAFLSELSSWCGDWRSCCLLWRVCVHVCVVRLCVHVCVRKEEQVPEERGRVEEERGRAKERGRVGRSGEGICNDEEGGRKTEKRILSVFLRLCTREVLAVAMCA